MRRLSILLLMPLLCAVACSNTATDDSGIQPPIHDFAVGFCRQLFVCEQGCRGHSSCQTLCEANVPPTELMEWQQTLQCSLSKCSTSPEVDGSDFAPTDGGTAACTNATDTSALCQGCLLDAENMGSCAILYPSCAP